MISDEPIRIRTGVRRSRVKESEAELKKNWLASLSCPLLNNDDNVNVNVNDRNEGCCWVIGVDPDVSGALALLKYDQSGSCCSSQVTRFSFSCFVLERYFFFFFILVTVWSSFVLVQ